MALDMLGRGTRQLREGARAPEDRAAAVVAQTAGALGERPAGGQAVDRDRRLGGVGGRRAAHGGHIVDERPVRVVTDRGDHGNAQQRDRPAQGLIAEGKEIGQRAAAPGDDDDVHLRRPRQLAQRAARVAQLEVDANPAQAHAPHLAGQLDAGELLETAS